MAPGAPQAEANGPVADVDQPTTPAQPSGGWPEAAEATDQNSEAGSAGKGGGAELRPSGRSDSTSPAGTHMLYVRQLMCV